LAGELAKRGFARDDLNKFAATIYGNLNRLPERFRRVAPATFVLLEHGQEEAEEDEEANKG
jgi:alpha-D-ribose 1-methylphosphonate 5-triphosphate synthase subunit PhnL